MDAPRPLLAHRATKLCFPLLLTACTLAPTYERPPLENAVPTALPAELFNTKHQNSEALSLIAWRRFFADENLQQVIALALENNRDLRIALLNVQKAEAQHSIARADLLPKINGNAQEVAQRSSDDLRSPAAKEVTRQYAAGIGTTAFEVDLFGRLQSLNNAVFFQYLGADEAQKSAKIALIAQVANTWLTYLADHAHLDLAKKTAQNQEAAYFLAKQSFEKGLISELILVQTRTTLETAKIDEARYAALLQQDENALSRLVGTSVPKALLAKADTNTNAVLIADIPAHLSSEVLLTRPDVMQAEFALKAANANIGAARAAFFPLLSITAQTGSASTDFDRLFDTGTRTWSFVPQLVLPIFQWGRNIANLNVADVQKNIQIAQYEKTIQTAFQEVADALADRLHLGDQKTAQSNLTQAAARAYLLSQERFRLGASRYLEVLDAQRATYLSAHNEITLTLADARNRIALYKALGGGLIEE